MKGVPNRKTIDEMIEKKLAETTRNVAYHRGKLCDGPGRSRKMHEELLGEAEMKESKLLSLLNDIRNSGMKCSVVYEEYKKMIGEG